MYCKAPVLHCNLNTQNKYHRLCTQYCWTWMTFDKAHGTLKLLMPGKPVPEAHNMFLFSGQVGPMVKRVFPHRLAWLRVHLVTNSTDVRNFVLNFSGPGGSWWRAQNIQISRWRWDILQTSSLELEGIWWNVQNIQYFSPVFVCSISLPGAQSTHTSSVFIGPIQFAEHHLLFYLQFVFILLARNWFDFLANTKKFNIDFCHHQKYKYDTSPTSNFTPQCFHSYSWTSVEFVLFHMTFVNGIPHFASWWSSPLKPIKTNTFQI